MSTFQSQNTSREELLAKSKLMTRREYVDLHYLLETITKISITLGYQQRKKTSDNVVLKWNFNAHSANDQYFYSLSLCVFFSLIW